MATVPTVPRTPTFAMEAHTASKATVAPSGLQMQVQNIVNTVNGDTGEWHAALDRCARTGDPIMKITHNSTEPRLAWSVAQDGSVENHQSCVAYDSVWNIIVAWLVPHDE